MSEPITLPMMRESLYTAVVCDALDSLGLTNQSPRLPFTAYTVPGGSLVGRCKTTLWVDMFHEDPEPYALELRAVDGCLPDDVLIAAAGGSMRSGIWGELLSTASRNTGCVGAIVDGAIRDVRKMREMRYPVYARGVSPYDSLNRQRVVDLDVPVQLGEVSCRPGDLIFADEDGIVIVPREVETEAIERAWKKVYDENRVREEIQNGASAGGVFQKYGIL